MKVAFTLLIIFCQAIVFAQPKSNNRYFEGVVEYDIKSESYMQGVSDNEIRERTGSTLKLFFKDGDYMREYIDGSGYTLRKYFYRKDKNMLYMYSPISSPDTLYFSSSSDSIYLSYDITTGEKEKILDYDCPSSIITAKYVADFLPDTGTIKVTYFFCNQLPVDPEWHKDVYIWNDVIKIHKSIAIKFIEHDPLFFKQTFTATKITWQPIDESIFKIDPKLVLVKMPEF
jgi:WD40 repeat protein